MQYKAVQHSMSKSDESQTNCLQMRLQWHFWHIVFPYDDDDTAHVVFEDALLVTSPIPCISYRLGTQHCSGR
jgi:hypothetical protein